MSDVPDCATHSGEHNESNRARLDAMIEPLHKNQSGKGRHKCVYCAYQKGREDANKEIKMSETTNLDHVKCKSLQITDDNGNALIAMGISTEANKPIISIMDSDGNRIGLILLKNGPAIEIGNIETTKVIDLST